jgi:DNA-binding SARP family transcriptional activator
MSLLHISLFGRFNVRSGQHTLSGLDARKVQELFCYLLLYRDRPHPREALADLLWDERHTDQPNRCLRKALWQLRSALDSQTESLSDQVLLIEPDWVQVSPGADLWLDTAVFDHTFECVRNLESSELGSEDVAALQRAVGLYRGGLQESWYQDWYLYERERFQHIYLSMLDKLMDYCEAHCSYEAGLSYGTLILQCERARERTYRRLMRLYCQSGDRAAALHQYEHCVRALDEELGVKPAQRTVKLYEQIRTGRIGGSTSPLVEDDRAPLSDASPLPTLLDRLRKTQGILAVVQDEIQQGIQALELTTKSRE